MKKLLCARRFSSHVNVKTQPSERIYHYNPHLIEWNDRENLLRLIVDNIIYNKDGIIAINKPCGLPISRTSAMITEKHDITPPEVLTLSDIAPDLCKHLQINDIIMVKSLLRKYSGIILLSTDKIIAEKLQKALSYNKCQKLYNQIFWALCVGVPVAGFSNGQKDIYLKEIKTKENINRYTMTDQISNSLITRREVHKHDIACECISRNDDTNSSYFKFSTNSIKHHCLNIFAAQKLLCPILGDHFYSQQLKFLNTFNSRVLIHPSECEYKSQHLPPQTKRALLPLFPKIDSPNSSSGQTYDIPCMLHLGSLTLRIPWVNDSNSADDLTISCPPPSLFTKTKSLLELD